jgi:cupin 2 domain-containing protein
MTINNILDLGNMSFPLNHEVTNILVSANNVRIERIVSDGQTTDDNEWYDENQYEFVLLLQGEAKIMFEHGKEKCLVKGDCLTIPARVRHRVSYTSSNPVCIWLAVFFNHTNK